jgi:hypothetical protein
LLAEDYPLKHFLFSLLIGLWVVGAQAQESAAVLDVRSGKVEILRVNTETWIQIGVGAVMPFGSGDRVRTNDQGRVGLAFGQTGEMLILPSSEFALNDYTETIDGVRLDASIDGLLVQRWTTPPSEYRLGMANDALLSSGNHSAVWVQEKSNVLAEGTATFSPADEDEIELTTGDLAWHDDTLQVLRLDGTLNAARAEAELYGCPAVVQTVGDVGVLVRRGIGQFNERLGLIPDESVVAALAINDAGYWVRIQYLNGFSWIVEDALVIDCPDLPRLSDQTRPERIYNIVNATDAEVDLLQPFFGLPQEDAFFYRVQ